KAEEMGEEIFEQLARQFVLQFADQLWKDHLLAVDRLRQGVSLRGYGQRNPLLEYKREAYHMYLLMEAMRDEMVLQHLINSDPALAQRAAPRPAAPPRPANDALAAAGLPALPSQIAQRPLNHVTPAMPSRGDEARTFGIEQGVGKNEPCPCG